ncbi:MAG: DUF1573 domain-containing protein [Cytophagaceae bacterium]|nr:DUF1573 domain-containing protein [Cytophagaceae bacterium]
MKKIFSLFLIVFPSVFSFPQTTEGPKNGPIITFLEKAHDFGDIQQGEKVEYVFKFKNTGTQPLIVTDVVTTCSCTAKRWTKEPIPPGNTGEVILTFDSAGKQGIQNKVITILSNAANAIERVSIRVNVMPKQ